MASGGNVLPYRLGGARTEGRWLNSAGEDVVLKSGRDVWWSKAEQFARERGLLPKDSRGQLDLSRHVEIKFAMRMRSPEEGCRQHEIIRIDREVCGTLPHQSQWVLTCDKQLATYLPPHSTLTVVEPDGTSRTYTGDEDP